jgi:hypothetical protein
VFLPFLLLAACGVGVATSGPTTPPPKRRTAVFQPEVGDEVFLVPPGTAFDTRVLTDVPSISSHQATNKPAGAFWTSRLDERGTTDWIDLLKYNAPDRLGTEAVVLEPRGARVYEIATAEDYERLHAQYPGQGKTRHHFMDGRPLRHIDWYAVSRDWDGVHLANAYPSFIRHEVPELDAWEVESTAWLDPRKLVVMRTVPVRDAKLVL